MEQNKNMTAVDWLYDQIEQYKLTFGDVPINVVQKYRKQAKQMEKEQLINARENGKWEITKCINDPNYTFPTSEQYYNETYGKE
jgi:hypothetical protein